MIDSHVGETVVFGWIVFESREARDIVNQLVEKDPRMAELVAPCSILPIRFSNLNEWPTPDSNSLSTSAKKMMKTIRWTNADTINRNSRDRLRPFSPLKHWRAVLRPGQLSRYTVEKCRSPISLNSGHSQHSTTEN